MAFWTDKQGKKLTRKEFFQRWKEGIEGVNPYQQTKAQMNSTIIILIGIVCGIVVTSFIAKQMWWLIIILVGALFNTLIQLLGIRQKAKALKTIYERREE